MKTSLYVGTALTAIAMACAAVSPSVTFAADGPSLLAGKVVSSNGEALAGIPIKAHGNKPALLIGAVRDWLRDAEPNRQLPSSAIIASRYKKFRRDLPGLCQNLRLDPDELTYNDYKWVINRWLELNG